MANAMENEHLKQTRISGAENCQNNDLLLKELLLLARSPRTFHS